MGTFSRFVIAIVLLLVVIGGIFGYKLYQIDQMQAKFSQPRPATVVDVTKVSTVSWQPSIQSIGGIRAINGVRIANELPGVVTEVLFESGQRVQKGDALIRLNSDIEQAALTTRQAEVQFALKEFQHNADLISKQAVSQIAFDKTKAAKDTAIARMQEAEARLGKKVLRAPFDGVLGLRLADIGEYLFVGTPIVEINMLNPILVQYTLSEKELASVNIGDPVEVTVVATGSPVFKGKVSAINSSITSETRTVQLRAQLLNPQQDLKPGMFATISTLAEGVRQVVAIPNTALSFNTYGNFAYVLTENEDGQLVTERRTLETGATREGMTEVKKGLQPGERIIASGLLRLRAGQSVHIKQRDTPTGGVGVE
ncbi:efflux RND transporter periplasmic adaptor subunit [Colwellia sp. C1TZA3]|uniref:efflux RND transporter periplasmic adaptor subunit n=1 Tax=Colwellia sp. C1TZA3 TaxID=2508879 RepID=UPI0011B9A7E3|nr:efflux RND transporter periplasmic adaptor subunit [Colwellia sp. C1TZA3]TWX66534.1 efflux RND transporter periplasmic adaptor subunit [Colwellia sp. C1TZA3]